MDFLRYGSVEPGARVVKLNHTDAGNRESVAVMEQPPHTRWRGLLIGASIISGTLVVFYWWPIIRWLQDFKDMAGWAQVVGSILAIFGAVHVANLSHGRQVQAAAAAERARLKEARRLAVVLSEVADVRIGAALKALLDHGAETRAVGWLLTQRTVEADLAIMKAFNLHDLKTREPMQAFALLIGFVESAVDAIRPLTDPDLKPLRIRELTDQATVLMKRLSETTHDLKLTLSAKLGPDPEATVGRT
jgi:hypothetical protein